MEETDEEYEEFNQLYLRYKKEDELANLVYKNHKKEYEEWHKGRIHLLCLHYAIKNIQKVKDKHK